MKVVKHDDLTVQTSYICDDCEATQVIKSEVCFDSVETEGGRVILPLVLLNNFTVSVSLSAIILK